MRALTATLLAGLVACSPDSEGDWTSQPQASGPCYDANLLDGLSEESTQELHDVYSCLNRTALITPLGELIDALDAPTRSGDPAGVELGRLVNRLAASDVDIFGLAGLALGLLELEDRPVEALAEVSIELLYGTSYERVVAGDVDLMAASSLDGGVLRPLLPGLRDVAGVALDDELRAATLAAELLASPTLVTIAHSSAALAASDDADVAAIMENLPRHLGQAIEATRDPSNDRWPSASGDSLRDVADKLLVETGNDGRPALEHLADPLRVMLADDAFKRRVEGALIGLDADGHLDALPPQLLYLAQVDADGGALQAGEDSALVTLLRLVHDANTPMVCSLDLWVTELEVDLGNLSVALIEQLSQQDPDTVEGGVDLLGSVIGWGISQSVLESVADSGVCPVLDRQMVADLDAIDRFNDPSAGDLLVVMLDLLEAFYERGDSRVPELVEALATLHAFGASRPIEELLRDLLTGGLVRDAVDLVGVLLQPTDFLDTRDFPVGVQPLDFDGAWAIAREAFTPRGSGLTAVEELAPALQVLALEGQTWEAVGNLGVLLRRSDARSNQLASLLAPTLALDPELEALRGLAPLLSDPAMAGPLLRVMETTPVNEALGQAELLAEGPMPFYARLVVSGTLDALLSWVDWSINLLRPTR